VFLTLHFTGDGGGKFIVEPGDGHIFAEHWASSAQLKT
jgi:hypothetical protein